MNCNLGNNYESKKKIFDYVIDNSMYVNTNECNNFTPPFISYIPSGIKSQNIDIENELRGSNYKNTKCIQCKYGCVKSPIIINTNNVNTKECSRSYNLLPNGYFKNN